MSNENFSKSNHGELSPDLEARVVAWVLGEASAFEAAELERLCAEQPELAVFKRRMQAVHGLVGEATKPTKEPLRLSPERRARVLAVIDGADGQTPTVLTMDRKPVVTLRSPKRNRGRWMPWIAPMAACLVVGFIAVTASFWRTETIIGQKKTFEASETGGGAISELTSSAPGGQRAVEHRLQVSRKGGGSARDEVAEARGVFSYAPMTPPAPKNGLVAGAAGHSGSFTISESTDQMKQFFDSDQPGPVAAADGFSVGLSEDNRWSEVASEVRHRRQFRPQGDQFSAPSIESGGDHLGFGNANPGALLDKARDQLKLGDTQGARESLALYGQLSNNSTDDRSSPAGVGPKPGVGDFIAEQKEAAKLVAKGRSQYLAGDIDGAQETFRTLETQVPESPEAKSFLRRIADERARVGELNRVKARSQLIQEVGNAWSRPSSFADVSAAPVKQDDLRGRLDRIIVPAINFSGVELSRVISTLSAVSEEYDGGAGGVNLVYDDPDGNPPVTITLRNLSLRRILELITQMTGYRYDITDDRVVILPSDEKKAEREKAKRSVFEEAVREETRTTEETVSTFSLHVSDASFRLAKAALERGNKPNAITVRPEEFYNAFDYGDPAPVAGEAVACRVEQAGHPFLQQRNLVRVAMRVPAGGRGASQPLRLTVLLDTSGSMEREDRAATVRAALVSLAALLGPNDRVSLVGFARTPRLIAENVSGDQAIQVVDSAARTPAEGGTNMEQALTLAGEIALRHKLAGAQNRIVLLTDGAANLGDADPEALSKRVEALRQNGIAFDACGIVVDGLGDSVLEALTRKGDGRYTLLHSADEADAAFAGKLAGAFRPAAKDVKVQVRFNPARVGRYRLIGFEQHRLKTEDFRNDAVDAAELAAEEAAVALYQVEVLPEGEGELGEVSVRFLETSTGQRVERSWVLGYVAQSAPFARATPSMQLAGSAAFLAEKLRGGALAGQVRLEEFAPVVEGLAGAYPESERVREFITMFRQARRMTGE